MIKIFDFFHKSACIKNVSRSHFFYNVRFFLQTPILNTFELKSVKKTNIVKKMDYFPFFLQIFDSKIFKIRVCKKNGPCKKK